MGDHPSNPSYDIATGRTLQEIIQADPRILGATVQEKFGKV
jgi:mannose-6-phosphate isomerase class I